MAIYGSGGTVTNAGTITGALASVDFNNSANNRLIVDPGAVFNGQVIAGAGANVLELAQGSSAGSIAFGANFTGFGSIAVDSAANWTLSGTNTIGKLPTYGALSVANSGTLDVNGNTTLGTIVNNGTIALATNASLDVLTDIDPSSAGVFDLNNGALMTINADTGGAYQIAFVGTSEVNINNSTAFGSNVGLTTYTGPLIEDFGIGDTIIFKNFDGLNATSSFSSSSGLLQIDIAGTPVASLLFQTSSLGSGTFHTALASGSSMALTHS